MERRCMLRFGGRTGVCDAQMLLVELCLRDFLIRKRVCSLTDYGFAEVKINEWLDRLSIGKVEADSLGISVIRGGVSEGWL